MKDNAIKEMKKKQIECFSKELPVLRVKAGLTQESLSSLIGVSRQTYYAIENNQRQMSWSTYLSLLFVYDCIPETQTMIKALGIYPNDFVRLVKSRNLPMKVGDSSEIA